jgi:hypothetical protein
MINNPVKGDGCAPFVLTEQGGAVWFALLSEQQKETLTAWENARPGSRSWRPTRTGYRGY